MKEIKETKEVKKEVKEEVKKEVKSTRKLNQEIRDRYISLISEFLGGNGDEVLQISNSEISIPVVDSQGNEKFLVLGFKIPQGSRDGEPFDAYELQQDYEFKKSTK